MVICLTGFSGAGKTSVAKYLVEKYNFNLISVREVSHTLANKKGYFRTRDWLKNSSVNQYLGECRREIINILHNNECNYVIDDVFDLDLWHFIQGSFDSCLINFHLNEHVRMERIYKRENLENKYKAIEELNFFDTWKKAFGICEVMNETDNYINVAEKSIIEIANEIIFICERKKSYE